MEFIGLISIICFVASKLLGGSSSNYKGGLNNYQKYELYLTAGRKYNGDKPKHRTH